MRAAIGQVGFQVQDLVVQLQSGTPVLTAFVQQGSQMAGAFGPAGAVIGTVGSLLAIAVGAMVGFNREAKAAEPILDTVIKSFDAAKRAAEGYGEALRGATTEQRNFATQAASVDVQSARSAGSDALSQLFDLRQGLVQTEGGQQFLTPAGFLSRLRGPGPLAGTPIIGSERDLRGEVETAIAAGKADEVSRLLREAGLLTSPQSIELANQAIEAANRVAVAQGIVTGEAAAAPMTGPPPGGMRTGFYGGGNRFGSKPAGPTPPAPAVVIPRSSGLSAEELARREAEQIARAREEAAARLQAGQIALYEAQAEETGKAYAAKWNESLAAEQQANLQAQVDILAEPARRAAEEIQNALAAGIYDGLNGQIKTIGDFFTTFKNIALQTVSQVAAAAILTPGAIFGGGAAPVAGAGVAGGGVAGGGGGIGAVLGLGGLLGGGGATLATAFPSLFGAGGASLTALGGGGAGALAGFGGASLAGIAGSAGLGFLGGSLIAPALGLNGLGGGIGGGLGAGLGFVVGGPLGALVGGGLGTLGGGFLGNAFGLGGDGSAERNNNFQYDIDLASGETSGSNTKPDQGNVDIVQQLTGRVQGLLDALQDMGGTTTGSINIQSGNRSGLTLDGVRYDNAEDLQLDAFRQIVLATTGLDPRVATAAGRSQATDAQEFISDLQFAQDFERLTGQLSAAAQAVEEFGKAAEEARARAEELGLSVEDLARAQQEQAQQLRDQALGSAATAVLQARSAFESLIDPLAEFRQSIALGGASPLSGRQQLGLARRSFDEAVRDANQGGTTADEVANVTRLGQQLLDTSRAVNGSSTAFFDDYRAVNRDILELQKTLDRQLDSFERSIPGEIRAAADKQSDWLARILEGVKDQVGEFREFATRLDDVLRRLAKA